MTTLLVASDKYHPNDVNPNIVVPYSNNVSDPFVWSATKLNLESQGFTPRYVDMNATLGADFAYDRLFRELWAKGEPFILVEHDIIPWPGALGELWLCDCAWGGFSYYIFGELRTQLGCTKFNPKRLGALPLPEEPVHWSKLDWAVVIGLTNRGQLGHPHGPSVSHLNYGHQRMRQSLRVRVMS